MRISDWSSDVCSSDLELAYSARDPQCPFIVSWKGHGITEVKTAWKKARERAGVHALLIHDLRRTAVRNMIRAGISEKRARSEERRVGKECVSTCRSRWSPFH